MNKQLLRYFFLAAVFAGLVYRCAAPSAKENEAPMKWQAEFAILSDSLARLQTDFEKTSFLRRYCAELLDIGRPDSATAAYFRSVPPESVELYRLFSLFKSDSIAAQCGIASLFYIKLVQQFGYKAYQYSFGFTDQPYARYIHSFPLVQINCEGSPKLIVQDPYLNLSFRDSEGMPLDFYQFLSALKRKQYGLITMDTASAWTSLIVPDTALYWPYLDDSCKILLRTALLKPNGTLRRTMPLLRSYRTMMQSACDHFERGFLNALRAHGYDGPFLSAYTLRVNSMVGDPNVKNVQAKIDSILKGK